ncbi:MAG TPA: hypothetical protein VMC42_05620 [Methanoregulaceae archaeon]|nr:hypothetical protein [Methanoregulaceae archaeon]
MHELKFLCFKDTDAKITLGQPDEKEWVLVGVFSRLSLAISQYAIEQQKNPDVPMVIQPYKGGEAGLFRKRVHPA